MKATGARTLIAVWGTSFDNVYAASFDGNIYYFDGSLWTQMYHDEEARFRGMWGSSPSNITVVGDWGAIVRYAGE